ncbi:unnamed protein product [Boreogadus saida]
MRKGICEPTNIPNTGTGDTLLKVRGITAHRVAPLIDWERTEQLAEWRGKETGGNHQVAFMNYNAVLAEAFSVSQADSVTAAAAGAAASPQERMCPKGGHAFSALTTPRDAYNENDLMLYWKNGNDSLRTDEIVLSHFFIESFHPSYGLAFYSSTGWYNRLYINFILRRHIFFFMLQTYFPTMLMVMLSWVSFWIDRRAVPARVSLGITTVLTMSTIITGVSASMPQVSYVKAVDIYLWSSFLFVFLSVIEYAAVNYFTTMEEMKKLRRAKVPPSFNSTTQAMAFDGCYHDNDIDLASFGEAASTTNTERTAHSRDSVADSAPGEGTRLRRKNPVVRKLQYVMSNSHMIDSYSRVIFPMSYLLFNVIYWSMYT